MNLFTKKKTTMKKRPSFVSIKQRIVALFTVAVMLLQICLPTIAWAASVLSNESIVASMASPRFQKSASNSYLYEQASFDDASYIGSQNITTFREQLVAAKKNLGKPTFVPIGVDITVFIPTYPTGKLIGDAYVQNRYIRQQVFDLLGRHLIYATDKNISEVAQINKLYDAAFAFATANPTINYGANLDAATLANLTADMIWPETRVINNENIVVPIVYLMDSTIRDNKVTKTQTEFMGAAANLGSITLNHAELTLGAGTIVSTAGNLTATRESFIASGGDLNLVVGGTLNLIGSTITGTKDVNILAKEINVKTVLVPFQDRYGSGTKLGSIASVNSTNGNISLGATGGSINFEAGRVDASNGSLTINAVGNISIQPLFTSYQREYKDGHWQVSASSLDVIGSRLVAKDTLSLIAGGAININASELISTQGGIEILASQGIFIEDAAEQYQKIAEDKKGKTTGSSSEFRTEAVRALLKAGKNIRIESTLGNIKLKAADITSSGGTQVIAKNGAVQLLTTTELEEAHLQTVRKGTWTIKTRTEDIVHKTKLQNVIVGGLQVEATGGVQIEYVGDPKATSLKQQLDAMAKMPGTAWMAEIYNSCLVSDKPEGNINNIAADALFDVADPWSIVKADGQPLCNGKKISWSEVEEIHKELRKTKRNLSPAAMAIIAIAIAVATGGAGAGLLAGGGGSFSWAATAQAAMSAGLTAIETHVVSSVLAGNSLKQTMKSLDDDEFINSLAVSMVTAGAMYNMPDFKLFDVNNLNGWTKGAVEFSNQAANAVARSAVTSGISVTIQGGNSSDYLKTFNSALAMDAVNTIGTKLHAKIANANWDTAVNYISHAALGCAAGALTNKIQDTNVESGCVSGAGGAVITEAITANFMDAKVKEFINDAKSNGVIWPELESKLTELRKLGIDISRLAAALTAFALKGDVNAAANSAEKVARSNVYKALDMINIYQEVNGNASTDPQREERIKQKYKDRVRAALEKEGLSPSLINSTIAKMDTNKVFEAAARFENGKLGDGSNIEKVVNSRAERTFNLNSAPPTGVENPNQITEVSVLGVPFSDVVGFSLDFLGATNRTVNLLTPEERESIGIAFAVITGGPLKTGLSYTLGIAMDKVLPAELTSQINDLPKNLSTAGVGFLISNSYNNTKEEYNNPINERDLVYDVSDWVDGLTWLSNNVIGLPGARGTNAPSTTLHINGNQNGNNVYHEFGKTHHFWNSIGDLYNDLKSAPIRISIMGKFSHYKKEDFVKYNDGKLGESVMLDVLEGTTGTKFRPMQNLSGHGPDGVHIDTTTNTIYIAEAKSSINGADKATPPPPLGSPTARLNKWMADYRAGKYDNADAATLNTFRTLESMQQQGNTTIKGVWVQVEVPKFNSSNITGVETIVSEWK